MATDPARPLRIVQWTTGNVARQTVRAVLAHPDQELVGVFAHSPDKVGDLPGRPIAAGAVGDLPVVTSDHRLDTGNV